MLTAAASSPMMWRMGSGKVGRTVAFAYILTAAALAVGAWIQPDDSPWYLAAWYLTFPMSLHVGPALFLSYVLLEPFNVLGQWLYVQLFITAWVAAAALQAAAVTSAVRVLRRCRWCQHRRRAALRAL
jgi:hypothetical protein